MFNYSVVETNERTSQFFCETLFMSKRDGIRDKLKMFEFNKMVKLDATTEAVAS